MSIREIVQALLQHDAPGPGGWPDQLERLVCELERRCGEHSAPDTQ